MTARTWFRKLFSRPVTRPIRQAAARCRPHLEVLEDRLAPAAYHVTSLSDDVSAGTLRDAITQANANPGPDTIDFRVTGTISLKCSQLPTITDDLTITGHSGGVTLDAGGASRIFQVSAGDVTLSYLTLTNGRALGADGANAFVGVGGDGGVGEGGAIYIGGGAVTLNNSTLANNIAQGGDGGLGFPSGGAGGEGLGGAIYVGGGAVTLNNSTLANNAAQGGLNLAPFGGANAFGGAIYVNFGASATLTNATVSGNSASAGGGLFSAGTVTLTNTIVAGNTGVFSDPNILGDYSGSHNLVDVDPMLAPLGDYGGPTQTMALLPGSPALDAGDSTAPGLPGTDQRGLPRDGLPDIGAFEAQESTFTVMNTSDSGAGSLRQAILDANASAGGGAINFDPAAFGTPSTIRLLSSLPDVTGDLTINGPTAARLTISGDANNNGVNDDGDVRILSVSAGDVTLSYLTLTNGRALGADGANAFVGVGGDGGVGEGGAIYVGGGAVTLNNSTLANNTAQGGPGGNAFGGPGNGGDGEGGAIYVAAGAVTLNNSTLANNTAQGGPAGLPSPAGEGEDGDGRGGAIYVNGGASATLLNSTLSGNTVQGGQGGGLFSAGTATLTNTIVAGNIGVFSAPNIFGDYSGSHNLVDVDPMLAPLGDYGGPTQTMALLPGSPALDAGDSTAPGLPGTDQRGLPRDALPDIGAFEAQEPTLTLSLTAVTVNEGSPATNTGTFDDLLGRATVTLTASLGTITRDDSTGNLSWSYTPADGPSGPTTVTLTATNFSGLTATATFTLTVNNVAPTASITGLPATGHSPEGTAISLGSTVTDPGPIDTAAGFTYAWSVTRNGSAYASGTTANFSFTPDDNGTYVVTLTATDKDGGASQPASATLTVDNVAPTAGVSGPADGVRGQARTFTLTASDPSSADQAAGFTFSISWGDGATQTVSGPSGTAVRHVYTASGTVNVQVTATDKDGGVSAAATQTDTITAVALETDPTDPTKTALVVGGTTGADTIVIKPTDASGTVNVKIGATSLGNFKPTGHIIVYGQAGDDAIKLQTASINGKTVYVSTPAFLFGDDGKDTLDASGSSANNVLEGGAGNDNLKAGSGRALLVGGLGADVLQGNAGDDILIGGTTDYDSNLAALNAVMSEWGRTDAAYQTRVNHLNGTLGGGLNSGLLLTANTVHDDAASDQLSGGAGMDWFFALLSGTNKDVIKDWASEVVTGL